MAKVKNRKRQRLRIFLVALLLSICAATLFLFAFFPNTYKDTVTAACETYDIPPSLVFAVIRVESNFDPDALSDAGAQGLMQITPDTYAWSQFRNSEPRNTDTNALLDPTINIQTGVHILALLYEEFDDTDTVLAAYNAGVGNVRKWLANPAYSSDGKTLDTIPYDETARYVQKVKRARFAYKMIYNYK